MFMFLGRLRGGLHRRGPRVAGAARGRPAHRRGAAARTGGNLEGKEQRFGIAGSALFDVVTTVTSCGAVNSAIESFTGIGGAIPFANLSAVETIFGGVGTGLYSLLLYVILAVFIGGLMVGRTPEFLGKKIEAREIKLTVIGLLATPLMALFCTAMAVATSAGRASISAAATGTPGLLGDLLRLPVPGQQQRLGVRRLHRLHPAQRGQPRRPRRHASPTCSAASTCSSPATRRSCSPWRSPARSPGKRVSPAGLGTMRTDNATFGVLLIGVIVLVGALTFFPALLLGPDRPGPDRTTSTNSRHRTPPRFTTHS